LDGRADLRDRQAFPKTAAVLVGEASQERSSIQAVSQAMDWPATLVQNAAGKHAVPPRYASMRHWTPLREVAHDLEPPATRNGRRAAVKKLNSIAAIASTLALTLEPKR
jgi:hypothetical protein